MIHPSALDWLAALEAPSPAWQNALNARYGAEGMPATSRGLLHEALRGFLDRHGNTAARVFRAPGRVNLRGMHVDTHGGFLNLMSHQREVFVVFSPGRPGEYTLSNMDPAHPDAVFDTSAAGHAHLDGPWEDFCARNLLTASVPEWARYLMGAALRAERAFRAPLFGLKAHVAGNVPPGAALSSSAALCVAAYGAICAMNGRELTPEAWILAARDAEWFTGARTGTSDQAASVLCGPGEICNVSLLAEDFSLDGLRRVRFPGGHKLLVINSHTRRSLSGAQKVAYTRNRFAYSMAMRAFQRAWAEVTGDAGAAARLDRLARIHTASAEALGNVYAALERVPERATLDELCAYSDPGEVQAQFTRYFGDIDPAERPGNFDLRGPLLYGIAESERARRFADVIASGDTVRAGRMMTTGHAGDRVQGAGGAPCARGMSIAALRAARAARTPIEELPGDYGASSPALDAIVDAALAGGALGACLTGAGIAGCVIALCRDEDTGRVADCARQSVRALPRGAEAPPLTEEDVDGAVVVNDPPAGAGELPWPC